MQNLDLKQQFKPRLSLEIQQRLFLLSLPILELKNWLYLQYEMNPLLELKEKRELINNEEIKKERIEKIEELDFSKEPDFSEDFLLSMYPFLSDSSPLDHSAIDYSRKEEENFSKNPSFFGHLLEQLQKTFFHPKEKKIALCILENLNESGYLASSIDELAKQEQVQREEFVAVLRVFHTLNPIGVGARNLQECLWIQAEQKKGKNSLEYKIVHDYFDALIQKQFSLIQKELSLSTSKLQEILKELSKFSFPPRSGFCDQPSLSSASLLYDLSITKEDSSEDKNWKIQVHEDDLPKLVLSSFSSLYLQPQNSDDQKSLKTYFTSGKSLLKNLQQRKNILKKIAKLLIVLQKDFLLGKGLLQPFSCKDCAEILQIHESTLFRAIKDKHIKTPVGIFPLSIFFSSASAKEGKISRYNALTLIKKMIEKENKKTPFSDQDLVEKLKNLGISCARRTVTKYRKKLKIFSSGKRRKFSFRKI